MPLSYRGRKLPAAVFLALLLLLTGGAPRAAAQQGAGARADTSGAPVSMTTTRVPDASAPLLDAPVSRTEYRLGPGDVVDVSIFGDLNFLYTLSVTPEGAVVIPTMGVAKVLGLNLDQAQARVRDIVSRFYRNVDVNLTLSQLRTFKVFVVGNVPQPGVRIASSATRVSEVVPSAGDAGIIRRNVLLRRSSGDTVRIDMARFIQTGDLSANPILREGDALIVPAVDETVLVFGRVAFPGKYEHRRGESLADLLLVVNGGGDFPSNAADSVRLTRFVNREQKEFYTLSRAEALGSRGRGLILQPFDAVYVAEVANYKRQESATIQGQVRRPGTYPIRPDTTTVRDLVALAGGFTPEAALVEATLRRQPTSETDRSLRDLKEVPAELLSQEERRILQIRSQGDEGNVVIDFQRLFTVGGDAYNQTLRSGDLLTVPIRRDEVAILGAVGQPGIVQYAPGRGINHFVGLAGGYSTRAQRGDVVVLKTRSGTRIAARDVKEIEPGDKIIVPFRERRNWREVLQTTGTVVSSVTGLVLAFIAATRAVN